MISSANQEKPPLTEATTPLDNILVQNAEAIAQKAERLRLKQTRKDLDSAARLLREAARLFKTAYALDRAADAYLQIGEIHFTFSTYDKALEAYHVALAIAGRDPELRCRILSHIARTYVAQGQERLADQPSKEALDLCESLFKPKVQAEMFEARGEALHDSDPKRSVELLSKAHDLFKQLEDHDGEALTLLMLAYAHLGKEWPESLHLAAKALELWTATGNRDGIAKARMALGFVASVAGEFETALCSCNKAADIFRELNAKLNTAILLNIIGRVKKETGDAEGSLKAFRQARASFVAIRDKLGEVEAISGIGMALTALHRYQQLPDLYAAKLRLVRQTGKRAQLASVMADEASAYELTHRYEKAAEFYYRSLAIYREEKHPYGEGEILLHMGQLQAAQGRYSDALVSLEAALKIKQKNAQVEDVARIEYELANIYRRQNRLEDARVAIERAVDIIESQRRNISGFDERASYLAAVHKYYSYYIDVLMLLQRQNPNAQFMVKAFEASERSKVRSLLDWLGGSNQNVPCRELLEAQLKRVDSAAITGPNPKNISQETTKPLSLQEAQRELTEDGTLLLEYSLAEENSYLWVVGRNQISFFQLPPKREIKGTIQLFRDALLARQQHGPGQNAEAYERRTRDADQAYGIYAGKLSRLLLGPVSLTSAKRIIIVADGVLNYVPFAVLPYAGRNLAIGHDLAMLPSVSALHALRNPPEKRPTPTLRVAAFVDPIFEPDDERFKELQSQNSPKVLSRTPALPTVWREVQPGTSRIPRLRESRIEADAIRNTFGKDGVFVAESFGATRQTFLGSNLGQYRIIHTATHGLLNEKHPEHSGLLLSLFNRQRGPLRGFISLSDIYKMKLSADLVVLSSCDSGLGKDLESEGIIGLPRAFLRAGAKRVIASLWKVDDRATAEFMKRFYSHIGGGDSPASALRKVQTELSRDEQWNHPVYWAGFVLQGEYK